MNTTDIFICGTMLSTVDASFSEWLSEEIENSGLNQSELARLAGISRGAVSHLINGTRQPGPDICVSIAKALKLPPENVLRAAGILPPLHEPHTVSEEIARYKIGELNDTQLDEVLQFIEFIQDRDDKTHRREFIERHTREGETPPEVIKK